MNVYATRRNTLICFAMVAFSVVLAGLWVTFTLPGSFNISDGGYFWVGSWLSSLGETPKLDFRSYDPLRYWWTGFFLNLYGNSWNTVAISSLLLVIGLLVSGFMIGLAMFREQSLTLKSILISMTFLILLELIWLFPAHKLHDHAASIFSCLVIVVFATHRSANFGYLALGIGLGVAALWGRNHLLYLLVSVVVVTLVTQRLSEVGPKTLLLFGLGVFVGYSPMLLLFTLNSGFADFYFLNSVWAVIERSSTNLSLPLYWPWEFLVDKHAWDTKRFALSLCFITAGLVYIVIIALFILQKLNMGRTTGRLKVLFVLSLLGICYLHHFYSRADFSHLAQSLQPLILLLVILLYTSNHRVITSLLLLFFLGASVSAAYGYHNGFVTRAAPDLFRAYRAPSGEKILVDLTTHSYLEKFQYWSESCGRNMAFLPNISAAYALNEIVPVEYNFYVIWPSTIAQQEQEVLRLAQVDYVVFADIAYDGNSAFSFSETNAVIFSYIQSNFRVIDSIGIYDLYQRRSASDCLGNTAG